MTFTGFIVGFIIGIILGCFLAWQDYKKNGVPPITIYKLDNEIYCITEKTNNEQ